MSTLTCEKPSVRTSPIQIRTANARLDGHLCVPDSAHGLVLFVHGSGSSRHSPRNRHIAAALHGVGLGTLLFDLFTRREEVLDLQMGGLTFDIEFLAHRVEQVTDWLTRQPETRELPLGYFGAGTGAAASLVAAAHLPALIGAVVSRGGRPDLAGEVLRGVQSPTLLIVGGNDTPVIALNQQALARLHCEKRLKIIPGATHLFEEPGALEAVARLTREWFERHLH